METREKVLGIVKSLLVGPNPLPYEQYRQENGEEILFSDSPLKTYVTGILFPQSKIENEQPDDDEVIEEVPDFPEETVDPEGKMLGDRNVSEPTIEAETSKINNYRQSAMGITLCINDNENNVRISVRVGSYDEKPSTYPTEKKDENGIPIRSEKERKCYFRKQINAHLFLTKEKLPGKDDPSKPFLLSDEFGKEINGLEVVVTYRMNEPIRNCSIYTVTLVNKKVCSKEPKASDCWFQCEFSLHSDSPFMALPSTFCAEIKDDDYQLNALLYRDVKTYAIGHGCAATWQETGIPNIITASVMPEYEVKPIVPTTSNACLSMKTYATDRDGALQDIQILCDEYENWIEIKGGEADLLENEAFKKTAKKQIELCKKCLDRMKNGLELLRSNDQVLKAFQLANKAMLLQQLHYRLPLTEFEKQSDLIIAPKNEIVLPDFDNEATWYNNKGQYGKWRPFQLAFILLNLQSIFDKESSEREIVDLIWFPTGGGKTEAYLGLTAVTIFLRRLKNPNDGGTAVLMRYTLRLLTAQQYERAASLICSIEKIRSENVALLGKERISIGLWVGDSLTKNNSSDVIKKIQEIRTGSSNENVSIMLKCPWCGASMETFKMRNSAKTPGYAISPDKKHVLFRCGNTKCDFSKEDYSLPLCLFDDEIYANPPTLLFGTVDKFAMLPFRPEAKSLFGGDGKRTPPELIIQDELHLITGPLGSAVGLYETLIDELCLANGSRPKIIASTATISHAKQQCNALYGCGEDNVFQFPVQGIEYSDCFFAREEKSAIGRRYVGLYGAAASSSATASIYTFAAFLYAAKAAESDEQKCDPYWTNLAYFGSMRELGQAATWYITDIKEHLEVIYRNRLESSTGEKRRYLYESGLAELTSRMPNGDIPKILKRLEVSNHEPGKRALDVCLATNMVSVGVDISRLGLMTVTGQPKSMSEYIQATSRVGRDKNAPGLVFVIYNTSKSRDKSHYEKFQSQHSKLYFSVEPTSVTPFSRPLRERALHAIFVALHRFFVDEKDRDNARRTPTKEEFQRILDIIIKRAEGIDPEEVNDIKKQLQKKWEEWLDWNPEKYHSFVKESNAPLLCQAGIVPPDSWEGRGWQTPMSMRSVDRECGLDCSKRLKVAEEDEDGE